MSRINFKYFAVEGVIGAGKTTLATKLSHWYGAHLVLEEFESNPFLEDFYNDPRRYAFQTQIFFLLSRFRQQEQLRQYDLFQNRIISDYMFQKDRIFALTNLNSAEMKLYDGLARVMEQQIAIPDFAIYLKTSTSRLMENIRQRNRLIESGMDTEYIARLNELYDEYFSLYNQTPLIIVNMDELDFVNNEEDFNYILEKINRQVNKQKEPKPKV